MLMAWADMRAVDESNAVHAPLYLRIFYDSQCRRRGTDDALRLAGTLGDFAQGRPDTTCDAPLHIGDIFANMLFGNLVHSSTLLLRRTRVVASGGFDPTFVGSGEDYEFHRRSCLFGPAALIDEPMISYRIGAGDQLASSKWARERARNALSAVKFWLEAAGPAMKPPPRDTRRRLAGSGRWRGDRCVACGENGGVSHPAASLRLDPLQAQGLVLFLSAIWPRSLRNRLVSIWRWRPAWARRRH
jgi:hypothetical protein